MKRNRFSFHTKAASAYAHNQRAKDLSGPNDVKPSENTTALERKPASTSCGNATNTEAVSKVGAGADQVGPAPSEMSDADARIVGGAFLETIQREMAKRQPAKPEPPTIDV